MVPTLAVGSKVCCTYSTQYTVLQFSDYLAASSQSECSLTAKTYVPLYLQFLAQYIAHSMYSRNGRWKWIQQKYKITQSQSELVVTGSDFIMIA